MSYLFLFGRIFSQRCTLPSRSIQMHPCNVCLRPSGRTFYFLFARFSCTIPPIFPSALKCWPIDPCLSRGPPIFCAVPPIGPSATCSILAYWKIHLWLYGGDAVPLNIDPSAPSLENMLVPVPVVFSPAAGCMSPSVSPELMQEKISRALTVCLTDS